MSNCKCGYKPKSGESLFCPNCGAILDSQEFENTANLEASSKELQDFIAKLNESVKSEPAPNTAVQGYFDEVRKIRHLLDTLIKNEKAENAEQLNKFAADADNFLNQDEFLEIAFVGTIKAGKSTLINALLKEEYASTAVTPETATLSKFKWGKKAEIVVSFYDQKEWNELWEDARKSGQLFLDKYNNSGAESFKSKFVGKSPITEPLSMENLAKYTSAQHPEHFFVKEVLISYPDFPYQKNIMFVDTPGLDDPVPYRSEVTKRYIKRAKVVLVCNRINAMDNGEVRIVYGAFDQTGGHPEKVYVLGTHYDTLKKPREEEWQKQKTEWSKYLTTKNETDNTCYTNELADKNIIPISGWVGFLCELHEKDKINATND